MATGIGPCGQAIVAMCARVQRHQALDEGGAAHARGNWDTELDDDGGAAVGGDRLDDFEGRGG